MSNTYPKPLPLEIAIKDNEAAKARRRYLRRKAAGYYDRSKLTRVELDYEAELARGRRRKAAQAFVDRLVADNPGASNDELLAMVHPSRRASLSKLLPTLADHYGTVTDIEPRPLASFTTPTTKPQRTRAYTPMVADLERRLAAAKAKTKRSVPGGRVNLGNASRPGDQADDVVRDFPAGERVR